MLPGEQCSIPTSAKTDAGESDTLAFFIRPAQVEASGMRQYDLHTHSIASDGSLSPSELVEFAHECGTDVLALTDHDNTSGLAEAAAKATELGIGFIPGIEVSVTWLGQTVHVLGLQIDADNSELQAGIKGLQDFRLTRAQRIAQELEKAGIPDALSAAKRLAKGKLISRTHFAHFLIETGHAKDMKQVFKRYLIKNKPGYVAGEWADLESALGWIRAAGGLAVLAHPARYKLSAGKLAQLLAEFCEYGGAGIEVVSSSHNKTETQRFTRLAEKYGLYASRGSDFHGHHAPYTHPQKLPELPQQCRPLWTHPDWSTIA